MSRKLNKLSFHNENLEVHWPIQLHYIPVQVQFIGISVIFSSPTYMEKFTPEVADVLGYLFQRFSKRWCIKMTQTLGQGHPRISC